MIPDAEKVIHAYLEGRSDVQLTGARIVGKTPPSDADPWVRITQLDAPDASGPTDRLIAFLVQFDCYAGDIKDGAQAQANALTRTVRAALSEMNRATHSGAVVTGVRFSGNPRLPDTDFEPARERYVLTATVWMHST